MSEQLQIQTSPPAAEVATSSVRGAGGEDLTIPADRETASFWAANWRRRGVDVDLVKRGRRWVVVG